MKPLRPALMISIFFFVFTGWVFPLAITAIAQTVFPLQANGSVLKDSHGHAYGSALLGQNFARGSYFHPRPSAVGYDAVSSSGTNLGPTSPRLVAGDGGFLGVRQLAEAFRRENGLAPDQPIPADAITRSASGLDPHISIQNAKLQSARVARARGLNLQAVLAVIDRATESGVDAKVVNVLMANRRLDEIQPSTGFQR